MQKNKRKTIGKITLIIGVIIIPLLYSFFYLNAFWDPYARLNDVPVAVVNQDKGAEINGETRNLGDEICDDLKEDGSVKFEFVDLDDAEYGVLNQKYYAEIIIPEDFSENASTVSRDTEKVHSVIEYKANQKKNYLAAQILENAMPTIKQSVNSSIDKEIVSTLCDKLESVPDEMGTLQDGFSQLKDGSSQLNDGADALNDGAVQLKDGAGTLKNGTEALSDGTVTLKDGTKALSDGTKQLNSNIPTLSDGVVALNDGAKALSNGTEKLNSNVPALSDGVNKLNLGSAALQKGVKEYTGYASAAAAGASKIKQGVADYTSNANKISAGASDLYDGVITASSGVNQITSQVEGSIAELNKTASDKTLDTLSAGAESLNGGLTNFATTYGQALTLLQSGDATKVAQATAIFEQLNEKLPQLTAVSNGVYDGVTLLTAGMKDVKTNTNALYEGLKKVQAGFGNEKTDHTILYGAYNLKVGSAKLVSHNDELNVGAKSLDDGLAELTSKNDELNGGAKELNDGTNELNSKVPVLSNGISALNEGAKALSNGTNLLNSKVPELSNGVKALNDGAEALNTGAKDLSNGASKIAVGSSALYDGLGTLTDGSAELKDGMSKLDDGINEASDGVDDSVDDTNEQLKTLNGLADYSYEPVSTKTEYIQPVDNYGSAFAPYFMCLSLWVGGLMIFFGIYLDYNKKIKNLTKESTNRTLRSLSFLGISGLQGLALGMVIQFALHIEVLNVGLLYASCVLVSIVFMSIIQFFIVNMGNVGKFISLLLLILQLTSCAGTFPLETQSEFFQVINKMLPMTYATQLFKEALNGTTGSWASKNTFILLGFLAVFVVLTVIGMVIGDILKEKKMKKVANA